MIKKVFVIITIVSFSQLLHSCLFFGSCPSPSTFEVTYNSVEIRAENTAGYNTTPIKDSINKSDLGITILVNFETVQIAKLSNFIGSGIQSAYALSCEGDYYEYPDDIKNISTYINNPKTGTKTNANAWFGQYNYDTNEYQDINEIMLLRNEGWDGFQFELFVFDSVPNTTLISVEVELESGIVFEDETQIINFY